IKMGTNIDWIHGSSDLDISPMAAIDESQAQAKIKIKPTKSTFRRAQWHQGTLGLRANYRRRNCKFCQRMVPPPDA
ncbi:MAG: hypothetical protein VCB63_00845, partial [Alphaproteobacteria bacterium]